jgi:hypothetical protein
MRSSNFVVRVVMQDSYALDRPNEQDGFISEILRGSVYFIMIRNP